MDANQIIAIEDAALVSLQAAIALWEKLRERNGNLPSVGQILAKANQTAQEIVKTADDEIAKAKDKQ